MSAEGWETDPTERSQWRWWDGTRWGDMVSCPGLALADPLPHGDWPKPEPPKKATLKERVTGEIRRQLPNRKTGFGVDGERFRSSAMLVVSGSLMRCILMVGDEDVLLREPTKKGTRPLLGFPRALVKSMEVEEWSAARFEYAWRITTGFLNTGRRVQAVSGVELDLGDQKLLFQVHGLAPIVRSQFELILDR